MNKAEFREALEIARSERDLSDVNISLFDGFGMPDFKQVCCSTTDVAKLIRYQALNFDGSMDYDALADIKRIGRRKFSIIALDVEYQAGLRADRSSSQGPGSSAPSAGDGLGDEETASESNSGPEASEGDLELPRDPVAAAVKRASKLFEELAVETYYGFNFRCVLRDLPEEALETLEAIVARAKLEREDPSARGIKRFIIGRK